MMVRRFVNEAFQEQRLMSADLTDPAALSMAVAMVRDAGGADVVYTDPPWSPGNEKWWRGHAKTTPPADYVDLLRGWCSVAAAGNPRHIFVEQSALPQHKGLFLEFIEAMPEWRLPLVEEWECMYDGGKRPYAVLHFGNEKISAAEDPTAHRTDNIVMAALRGLPVEGFCRILDPCMGLGMVSRCAHRLGWSAMGSELNPARLQRTISWIEKQGYRETV